MNDDYLDIGEDDDKPSTALPTVPETGELEVLNALSVDQRAFAEVWTYCRFNTVKAREMYRDNTGKALPLRTMTRWWVDPIFLEACAKLESLSAKLHGVSKAQVLADLAEIKTRRQGTTETGDRLALEALTQISKCLGQYANEDHKNEIRTGPNLFVQVVASDGTVRTCTPNYSDTTVRMGPPIPDRLINP